MEFYALIQARRGSTRLPHKVIELIEGKPMLAHVISRTMQSKFVTKVIVATTDEPQDKMLGCIAAEEGAETFYGSSCDVLDRYYNAARKYGAKYLLRITADCPLIDPDVIDLTIKKFCEGEYDHVSNAMVPTYPDGLDTEVFTFEALQKAWENASLASEREHVTPYIWKNPVQFRLGEIRNSKDLSALRWTVDQKEDLIFVRKVYHYLYPKNKFFRLEDVLKLLEEHPDLSLINSAISRNEGYAKSLKDDKVVGSKNLSA